MSDIPALSIQGMARKFVRGSIIEDAAAKLLSQIMTEVADAHIVPRDAEISRLTSRIAELEKALKPFADEAAILDAQTRLSSEARIVIGELRMKHLRNARTTLEASDREGDQ